MSLTSDKVDVGALFRAEPDAPAAPKPLQPAEKTFAQSVLRSIAIAEQSGAMKELTKAQVEALEAEVAQGKVLHLSLPPGAGMTPAPRSVYIPNTADGANSDRVVVKIRQSGGDNHYDIKLFASQRR